MAKKLSDIKLDHDFFDKDEYEEHLKEAAEQGRSEAAQSVIYYDDSKHITRSMFAGLDPKTTPAQVKKWVAETMASLGFTPETKEYESLAGQIKSAISNATKSAESAQKVRQTGTAKGNRKKRNVNLGSGQPEGAGPTTEEYHAAAHADLLKQYDNHIASNPMSDEERAILHQYGHAHDGSWTVIRRKPTKSQAEYDALADPSKSKTDEASPESGYTPGQLRAMMTAPPIRTRSSERGVLDPDPGGAIGEELYAVRRRVRTDDQGNFIPYDEVFRAVRQKTQAGFAGPFMAPDALSVSSADKAEGEVQGISNKAISTRDVPSLHSPLLYQDRYPARTVAGRLEAGRGAVLATGNKLRDARSAFRQLTQGTGEDSLAGMASKAINAGPTATFDEQGQVVSGFGKEQFGEGFAHSLFLLAQELGFRLDENAPIPRLDEVFAPLPKGADLDLINSRARKLAEYNNWIKGLARKAAEVTDSRFQSATTVKGPDGFPTGGVTHADIHDALSRYIRQHAKPGNFLQSRNLYMPGFPIKYKLSTRTGEARVLTTYQDRPKLDDDGKPMKDANGNYVMERVTVLPPKMSSYGPTAGKYGMAHGQVAGSSDPARPSDRSENVDVSFAPEAFHEQDSAQRVINTMNTFNHLLTKMSTAVTQAKRDLTAAANEHASASRKLARDLDVFTTLDGIEPWDAESEARAAATGGRLPPRPVAVEQIPGTRDPATGQEIARTVRPEQVIGDAYGRNYSRSRLTAESTPNDFVSVGEDAALSAINADAALGDEIESKNIQGVDEAATDADFNPGKQVTDETGDMAVGDPANDQKQELLRRIFGPEDTSGYNDEVIRKALADLKEGEVLTADHLARAKVGVQPAGTNGIVLDKDNLNAQQEMALIDPTDQEAVNKAVENAIAQTTRLTAHDPTDHRLTAQRMVTVSRPVEKPGTSRQFQGRVPDLLPLSPGDPEKGIEPRYLAGGFAEGRSGNQLPYHEQVLEELRSRARQERGVTTSEDLQGDIEKIEDDIARLSESHQKAGEIQEEVSERADTSEDDLLEQEQAEEDKEVAKGNVAATPLVRGEDLLPGMSSSDEVETADFATPMRHIYGVPRDVPEADTRSVGDEMAEKQARLEESRARLKADAPNLHSMIEAHLADREAKKKAHAEAYAEWQQKDAAAREAEAAAQPKRTVVPIGGQRIALDPALAETARAARAEADAARPDPVTHESEHTEKLAALLNGKGPAEVFSVESVAAKLGVDLSASGAAGHRAVRKLYGLLNAHEQGPLKGRRRSIVTPEAVGQALLDLHETAPEPSGSRLYDPEDPNLGKPATSDPSRNSSTGDLTLAGDQSEAEWKRQWAEVTTVKYPTKPKTDATGKVISTPEISTRRVGGPRPAMPGLTPVSEGGDLGMLSNLGIKGLLAEADAGADESVKLARRLGLIRQHASRYAGALQKGQTDKLKDPVTGKLMSVLEFVNHRISTSADSPEAAAARREAVREQGRETRADEGKLREALDLHNKKFADLQDKHEEVKENLEITQEVHDEHKQRLEDLVKSLRTDHNLVFVQGSDPISAEQAQEMSSSLDDEASLLKQRGIDPDTSDHELAVAHRQRRNMVNKVQAMHEQRGILAATAQSLGKLQRSEASRRKQVRSHKYYDPSNPHSVNEFRERWAKKQRSQENQQAKVVGQATPLVPMPEPPVGGYASDEQRLQHHDEHLSEYLDHLARSVTSLESAYAGASSRAAAVGEARYQTAQDAKEELFNNNLDLFHPGETIPEITKKIMADPEAKRAAVGTNGEINIRAYNEHKFRQAYPHTDPKHQHLYSMAEDGTPVLNFERILMEKTPEAKARAASLQYDPLGTSNPAAPSKLSSDFPPDHPVHAARAAAAGEVRRTLAGVLEEAMGTARDVAQRTLVRTDQGIEDERRRGTVTHKETGKQTTLGAAVDSEIDESEQVRQANERAKQLRENPLGTGEAATVPLATGRGRRGRGKRGAPGQGSEVFVLPPVEETPPPPTPGINKLIRDQEAGAPVPGRPPSGGKTGRPARPTGVSGIDPTWLDARNVDALGARRLDAEGVQMMADRYHQYRSDLHKASVEEYQNYGVQNVGLDSSPKMPHIDEHPAVAKALGDLRAHEADMAAVAQEHQSTYRQLHDTVRQVQSQVGAENPGIDPDQLRAHPAVADAIGQLHAHLSVMNDMESKRNALATEVDQARLQAQAERQSSTIPVKTASSPKVAVAREMLRSHEEAIRNLHPVDRNSVLAAISSARPTAVYSERSDRQTRPILDRVEAQQQVDATIQAASRLTRPKDPVTKALLPNRPWTSVDTLGIGVRGRQFRGGPEIITEPATSTQQARAGVLRDVGVRMAQEGAGLATGENVAGIQEGGFRATEVPLERASEIMRPYRIAAYQGLTGPDIGSVPEAELRPSVSAARDRAAGRTPALRAAGVPRGLSSELAGGFLDPTAGSGSAPSESAQAEAPSESAAPVTKAPEPPVDNPNMGVQFRAPE